MRQRGYTLTEIIVVITAVAVLVAILIPVFKHRRRTARQMPQSVKLRYIHQGLVLWSQGNNSYYTGRDATGKLLDATVEGRLPPLLAGNYLTPPMLISPAETEAKTPWVSGPFTAAHWSYAMLSVTGAGRLRNWLDNSNTKALMLSDRNTGADTTKNVQSIWTKKPGEWKGDAIFNDDSHRLLDVPHAETQYAAEANKRDDLFNAAGENDALLIHTGE